MQSLQNNIKLFLTTDLYLSDYKDICINTIFLIFNLEFRCSRGPKHNNANEMTDLPDDKKAPGANENEIPPYETVSEQRDLMSFGTTNENVQKSSTSVYSVGAGSFYREMPNCKQLP